MSLMMAITVGVIFAVSIFLLTGRELKGIAMGVFLLGHGANLTIIAVSRSPLGKYPPILGEHGAMVGNEADPLPQALILTAIVIGFAVQAFLLTKLVLIYRRTGTLHVDELRDKIEEQYTETRREQDEVEAASKADESSGACPR